MKNCMDELAGLESQYGGTRSTNQSTLLGKKRPEAGGGGDKNRQTGTLG